MNYIIWLLFLVIGICGLIYQYFKWRRKERINNLLEISKNLSYISEWQNKSTPIEQMLKKSSRVIHLTDLLDRSVVTKLVVIVLLSFITYSLDEQGVLQLTSKEKLLIVLSIAILIILVPGKIKKITINNRLKNVCNDLPFIIDLMAICVQSGMTIESAISYIARNSSHLNSDISSLLTRTMLKNDVRGMDTALTQLYEDIPASEVRMFCSALQQSIKYGSSVYQTLMELSKEIREIQLLTVEEKVASLSARMTVPMIVFIMFPLLAIVAGPGIIGVSSTWGS